MYGGFRVFGKAREVPLRGEKWRLLGKNPDTGPGGVDGLGWGFRALDTQTKLTTSTRFNLKRTGTATL